MHEAKVSQAPTVTLWGSGEVYREFMCADDLASACIYLIEKCDFKEIGEFVNIGSGEELKIRELANMIKGIVGYTGEIVWDTTKPDGTPKKLLDVSHLKKLGWQPEINLPDGLRQVYDWYLTNLDNIKGGSN
jgi:GDP-L-fucose synthase